jgi:hypothetical protein
VSSFGINLDLRLNGETALNRAIRGAKSLENIVKRLNDKPLDLSNIGGAARLEEGRLGKARKEIIAFAQELRKSQKPLANTEAGIREYVSAFTQLASNTKAGTPAFEAFVGVVAKAEKELGDLARATENAKRAQLGLLSVEEEAAELAAKEQQAKAKAKEAKARRENERQAEREAAALKRANRQREREAQLAKRQRGRAIGDLAASVGFPLLFGGGVGSVAGGAIGSLVGSAAGIGFGGQILGSALGQGLDKAAQAANEFALAATKASTSIDALIQGFGLAGTGTASSLRFAETLGIGAAARTASQGGLASIVGESGVKSLEDLATSAEDAGNALNRFGAATTATFAPILTNLNQAVTGLFGGISKVEELRRATDPANQAPVEVGGPGSAARQEFQRAQAAKVSRLSQNPEVKAQLELEEKINKVVGDRVQLAERTADLESSRLTSRRDVLAVEQGNLAVQAQQNKLDVLAIQLAGDLTDAKRRELELEESLTLEAKRQAEAARENARIEAERQIQREQISGAVSQIGMLQRQKDMQLQFNQAQQGRFSLLNEETAAIEDRFDVTLMTLDLENKRALIGVAEVERISSINREFEYKKRLAQEQYYLDLQSLEQANAAYNLSRLQVEQALELQRIQAATSAQQQIRQTSPFEREAELLDPFFGGSRQLETDQQAAFTEQLGLLEKQLEDVNKQQEIFALSPVVRKGLEDKERIIRNQIANFKEYQPAIDEAALAQMRFNEAMAITVPVTDSLFNNLLAIAEGTKTAKEAFAGFLRDIGSLLLDAAKKQIATYIAIGIARAFAGMGGSGSSSTPDPFSANVASALPDTGSLADIAASTPLALNAAGSYVSSPTATLVGEGGQGEYIIPEGKMRESMARYSRGARGSAVIPDSGASGTSGEGGGTAVAAPIDVRFNVERINNVDYVTAEQFQVGLARAAQQGAAEGERRAMGSLRNSAAVRRRIGV